MSQDFVPAESALEIQAAAAVSLDREEAARQREADAFIWEIKLLEDADGLPFRRAIEPMRTYRMVDADVPSDQLVRQLIDVRAHFRAVELPVNEANAGHRVLADIICNPAPSSGMINRLPE